MIDEEELKWLLKYVLNDIIIAMHVPGVHNQEYTEALLGRVNDLINWTKLSTNEPGEVEVDQPTLEVSAS